jgi:cyclopropane fatty-acyl-phospholipid synthase-like methyltransferase
MQIEQELEEKTEKLMTDSVINLSDHWSYNFRNDPKRLGFVLSRYKFAARMGAKNRTILELGCGEGIGATILAETAAGYTGVDLDAAAILTAKKNLTSMKYTFIYDDFMGKFFGTFQTVVSLDVLEHIYPEHESTYFETIMQNLCKDGIAIIGTPNITAAPYASEASNLGHVNLFSQQRLQATLQRYFFNVFPFGMNDEMMHTGFASMAHYIVCVACNRRSA